MQYGYFDDEAKEYVITRPDTPRSWTNYLGDTRFGGVITQNAGGYSFYRSAGEGRILRFRFNAVPADQPGRYLYIRDDESGDYWTASWQPVGKPLERYRSRVRFGTGYAVFEAEYDGIRSTATYFVPLGRTFEIWHLLLENLSGRPRRLSVFSFAEYPGNWNAQDDLLNLQYTQFTVKMSVVDGIIDHGTNVLLPPMPERFTEKDQGRHTFMALVGAEVVSFDTDREAFLGPYRTYANPLAVERGRCSGSLAHGDNGCGSLHTTLELAPGERRELAFLVGIGRADVGGKAAVQEFGQLGRIAAEFERLRDHWHDRLQAFLAHTPDADFNSMFNVWNPYNCLITYSWARAASLIYTADERDGLGFRDSAQDLLGVIHLIPEEARERLELLLTGQVSTGGALPVIRPFDHHPGEMEPPAEEEYRADDCLWLFNAVPAYVKETGDLDFFRQVLPYADRGEDTVLSHLRRAIEFNLERSGAHGLPSGLKADWNDCLRLGRRGESAFVAFQLRLALREYGEISRLLGESDEAAWAERELAALDRRIEKVLWDGRWYLRAIRDDGFVLGSRRCDEGKIFMNPQAWAVISGHASPERARQAMDAVHEHLASPYGIQICDPPFVKTDHTVVLARYMNVGTKENAGIFQHTQGWAVIAEAMLGRGARAYEYYRAFLPAAYNDRAELREVEPYVYGQSTHSKYSPRYGASRVPWLTGSAAWAYYAASQYILGLRPDYGGLWIDPCVPPHWKAFELTRRFRGKLLRVQVTNPDGVEKGVVELRLNGEPLERPFIPAEKLREENEVQVVMG